MEKNVFEQVHAKKQNILAFAKFANEKGLITEGELIQIQKKIDEDKLTLGVIGQMNCGKSTFLNALVFEDDVLPAAVTPMTSSLSVITYGKEKKVEAEFYTQEEWNALNFEAERVADENGSVSLKCKHQTAVELVEKSKKIGSEIGCLLGKKKTDSFENLINYVGADGKYTSITKLVTIYYPKEYLKGVELVDTPGFNDPVVSREERTKEFLKRADVVLMLLYAGQPFSAADKSIVFDNIRACGVAKVLMGINKYDLPYEQGESIQEVVAYVINQVLEACKSYEGEEFALMLKELVPLPVSTNMALLSMLPLSKIQKSKDYLYDLNRFYNIFDVSDQAKLYEKSLFGTFEKKLLDIITSNKDEILFKKPLTMIEGRCLSELETMQKEVVLKEDDVQNLSLNDKELDEKRTNVERAYKRIKKKVEEFSDKLNDSFDDTIRKTSYQLKDSIDAAANRLKHYANDIGLFTTESDAARNVNDVIYRLEKRDIPVLLDSAEDCVKEEIRSCVKDFTDKVLDILNKYLPDLEVDDIVRSIHLKIDESGNESEQIGKIKIDIKGFFENIILWLRKGNIKQVIFNFIEKIQTIDVRPYLEPIKDCKETLITAAKTPIIDELLEPMQKQLDGLKKNIGDKEARKLKACEELAKLKERQIKFKTNYDLLKKQKIELEL